MEPKIKKISNPKVIIDLSLDKYKDMDLFPEKTKSFDKMVKRIGEDKFSQLSGAKKRNLNNKQ